MKVFLSYASTDRALAERVCRVLEAEGYDVFFDRDDLGGGDAFGERIRTAIRRAHVLVYLISASSVTPPSYALTELGIVTGLTSRRRPVILPVRTDGTSIQTVPAALRAYTILEPQGDVPAEIATAVDRIRTQRRRRLLATTAAAVVAAGLAGMAYVAKDAFTPPPSVTQSAVPSTDAAAVRGPAAPDVRPPVEDARPAPLPAPPAAPSAPTPRAIGSRSGAAVATPDPLEALNQSILKRTPPDRRVTLIGMPGNDGWSATMVIADQSVTKVQYRLDGETTFVDTGSGDLISPLTGQPRPNTFIQLPGAFWRPRRLAVKYTDVKGEEHGPVQLDFDPRAQFLRFTRQSLGNVAWVSFNRNAPDKLLAYFTTLVSFKSAFKEIRYSIESDAFDQVFPLKVDPSAGWPAPITDDILWIEVPVPTTFLNVKLTLVDGTVQTRKFEVPR